MRRKLLIGAAAGSLVLLALLWVTVPAVKTYQQVRADYRKSDVLLYDRNGEVIHEVRVDPEGRRLDWVPLDQISPALTRACIFAEDRDFQDHGGVDWGALVAGAWGTLTSGRTRGASTITMQTASLIDSSLQPRRVRRSWFQKVRQIAAARVLDGKWSKDQILEAYLNLVSFRGELQGVAAASRGLFGKQPHGLDDAESAVLAAMIRSPNAPPDQIRRRAEQIVEGLGVVVDGERLAVMAKRTATGAYQVEPRAALAPHVARLLLRGVDVTRPEARAVRTTLWRELQAFASDSLTRQLLSVHAKNVQDGAVLVVDNARGEVLAYVGNGGEVSSARYVDGVQAFRQAGSTLKPFLYGLAFERRILTPASLLEDNPLNLTVAGGLYRPSNYDNQFRGPVAARVALASSMNVPAVRALELVGVEEFVRQLQELGFRELRDPDFYGPSLALGAVDVSLWDLVAAYRSLANHGIWSPLQLDPAAEPQSSRQILTPQTVFLVSNILSDRESRSETFGLDSPLSTRFWSAAKTGTSKDMRDNWCVGWSDRYTVGVWVGNFSGEPMWNVSGITGAAPVWLEVMNWLHRDLPSAPPSPPPGVVARQIHFAAGGETRGEWFLEGTAPEEVRAAVLPATYKIAYPPSGTTIALDPDIPPDLQKVFFEAAPPSPKLRWVLNGQRLGPAGSLYGWRPKPGNNLLRLVDESDRVLDEVAFQVRGGG